MKTTLNISDEVMRSLKIEAARQGKTMSELVETALRALLQKKPEKRKLKPLPTFDLGGFKVDISNRQALYDAMDEYDRGHRY
jgi:plasmid stability protein